MEYELRLLIKHKWIFASSLPRPIDRIEHALTRDHASLQSEFARTSMVMAIRMVRITLTWQHKHQHAEEQESNPKHVLQNQPDPAELSVLVKHIETITGERCDLIQLGGKNE